MTQPPEEGFLSSILDEWSNQARTSAPAWFALVDDLNRCAVRVLPTLQPHVGVDRELATATLYARAVQTFEASILLARRGMLADAETLARSIVETALFLGGLACIDDFIDRMAAANNNHFYQHGKAILDFKDRNGEQFDQDAEELKVLLEDVKAQGHKFAAINMKALALEIGMDPLYDTVYRLLSGSAAHPSLASLERHIVRSDRQKIEKLNFSPQREGLEKTFSCAIFALLSAMEGLSIVFERADIKESVDMYNSKHQALVDGLCDPVNATGDAQIEPPSDHCGAM